MKKILIVSPVVSYPQASGNTTRISELCECLLKNGFDVHFCFYSSRYFESHKKDNLMEEKWAGKFHQLISSKPTLKQRALQKLKKITSKWQRNIITNFILDFHFSDHVANKADAKNFKELTTKIKPNVVIVEYASLSELVTLLPQNIIKVVDTHDVFAYRNKRIRNEGGFSAWMSFFPWQENKMLKRFNTVLAIQYLEYNYFKNKLKNSQTDVKLVDILEGSIPQEEQRNGVFKIGFIGAKSRHNYDGLKIFLELHWKKIKQHIPEASLSIAGAIYSDLETYERLGVRMLGRVDSIEKFYNDVDVIINPTFAGSGLKIKSVEALRYGKLLITTPEGSVGLEEGIEKGCIYCSELTSTLFVNNVINALNNDQKDKVDMQNKTINYIENKRLQSVSALLSSLSE
jgi:hypothetical protein